MSKLFTLPRVILTGLNENFLSDGHEPQTPVSPIINLHTRINMVLYAKKNKKKQRCQTLLVKASLTSSMRLKH